MDYDILLAGGGLANGLIALRLAQTRPEVRVGIVEAGKAVGGNHTWSSFAEDLTPEQREWTAPLFAYRWDRYEVRFPGPDPAAGSRLWQLHVGKSCRRSRRASCRKAA